MIQLPLITPLGTRSFLPFAKAFSKGKTHTQTHTHFEGQIKEAYCHFTYIINRYLYT